MSDPGPEEFVDLQGLVQNSNLFGISSVQFSYLFTTLSGNFIYSVQGTGAKCLRSVRSVQFSSRTVSALTRIDLAGSVRLRLGLVHRVSNWLGGAKEQL